MPADTAIEDLLKYLAPLFAVVLGWVLHELSDSVKLNREDRRAVGRLLAELLEIRHSLRAVPIVIRELRTRVQIPAEVELQLRQYYSELLTQLSAGASERYNKSVDAIAGRLPMLAHELRSKDQLGPALSQMRSLAADDPATIALFPLIEENLEKEAIPRLEDLCRRVAWKHGLRTWLSVRSKFNAPDDVPVLSAFFDSLFKNIGTKSGDG